MRRIDELSAIIVAAVLAVGIFAWYQVIFASPNARPVDYFLDVGQGDAELIVLPGNVKIMTDAGPDQKIVASIGRALGAGDHYVDIGIISHPQLDHFNGYNFLLDRTNRITDAGAARAWRCLAKIRGTRSSARPGQSRIHTSWRAPRPSGSCWGNTRSRFLAPCPYPEVRRY